MRKSIWLAAAVLTLAGVGVLSSGRLAATAHGASKMKDPMMWAAEDLKWVPMQGREQIQVATLWGSMDKGNYGAFIKFPPNDKHPLHTHSADVRVIVISGSFLVGPEGGPEKEYGPGSYVMVPGGFKHTSASGSAETVIFQESAGKWDMKPVEAK